MQRVLGLASVHLDTGGHSIHAVLKDRSVREVEEEMGRLPDLCRLARRAA